jgi:hypothetical protein
MTTVNDIVTRAYRKIGVVATDEPMTADQGQIGQDALNMMMHALTLDGIDVAWTDATLVDQFAMEPAFHEGVVYMLAARLAPDFSQPSFDESAFKRRIAAAYLIVPEAIIDRGLRMRRYRYGRDF